MDCPECGTPLTTYRLDGQEASVCERCGYVGIEAEHRGNAARVESWTDALRRFYGGTDTDLTLPVGRTDAAPRREESWTDALRRFYGAPADRSLDVPVDPESRAAADESGDGDGDSDDADDTAGADDVDDVPTPASVAFDGPSVVARVDDGEREERTTATDGAGAVE